MHYWRKGVPQIDQPHQLTAGGVMALEHLFPGFVESVVQHGGTPLDLCKEVYYFDHKGKYPNFTSNLQVNDHNCGCFVSPLWLNEQVCCRA
jgi:hypothetical protein